jgi:hypothetical protein
LSIRAFVGLLTRGKSTESFVKKYQEAVACNPCLAWLVKRPKNKKAARASQGKIDKTNMRCSCRKNRTQ